jgi:hypothetical protein
MTEKVLRIFPTEDSTNEHDVEIPVSNEWERGTIEFFGSAMLAATVVSYVSLACLAMKRRQRLILDRQKRLETIRMTRRQNVMQSVISGFVVLMVTVFLLRSATAYFYKKKREKLLSDEQKIQDNYFSLRIFHKLNIDADNTEQEFPVTIEQKPLCDNRLAKTLSKDVEMPMTDVLHNSMNSQKTPECSETSWSSESFATEESVEHENNNKKVRSRWRENIHERVRRIESLRAAAQRDRFDEELLGEFDQNSNHKNASRFPSTEVHQTCNDVTTMLFPIDGSEPMSSDLPKTIDKPRSRITGELVSLPL